MTRAMGKTGIRYLQRKRRACREHHYFRVVRPGQPEFRLPLPHPTDPTFPAAYAAAWEECFGAPLDDLSPTHSIRRLCAAHRAQPNGRYAALSPGARGARDRAIRILCDTWGQSDAHDIRPIHAQALYDRLAADSASAANRFADDARAIWSWGTPRGYADSNPWRGVERIEGGEGYEPWPIEPLTRLIRDGAPHIVRVAILALYTGQDRGDVLAICDAQIEGETWVMHRAKTRRRLRGRGETRILLHPMALAVIAEARAARRQAGILDPQRPLLTNSRGQPWGTGFGASWHKELARLGLANHAPALTFKGLRVTNATMIAEAATRGGASASEAMARVRAMLSHHSPAISAHYARRAEVTAMTADTVAMLPSIGQKPETT
jgi:hypothetical protein